MDTIIFYANSQEDALKSVTVLCDAIKNREDANHELFFTRRLMGEFLICKGHVVEDDKKEFTGNHEIIIFPAARVEDLERLKAVKNIVDLRNCMWFVGDSEGSILRVNHLIDWLLDDDLEYS